MRKQFTTADTPFDRAAARSARIRRSRTPLKEGGNAAIDSANRKAKGKMLINYLSYALPDVRQVSPGSAALLLELLIETIKQELASEDTASAAHESRVPATENN